MIHHFHFLFLLLLEAAESVVQLTKGQRAVSLFSLFPHCQFSESEKSKSPQDGWGLPEVISCELCGRISTQMSDPCDTPSPRACRNHTFSLKFEKNQRGVDKIVRMSKPSRLFTKAAAAEVELPWWLTGKASTCQCRRCSLSPWAGDIPWSRTWQPTLVFLPWKSHAQSSLAAYSPRGHKRVRHDLVTKTN